MDSSGRRSFTGVCGPQGSVEKTIAATTEPKTRNMVRAQYIQNMAITTPPVRDGFPEVPA